MRIAGTRVRGTAVAYVVFEDALIVGALLGAFAFAHYGSIRFVASPLRLLPGLALLLSIKAAFFWCGLYDFRHLVPRATFWRRLFAGFLLSGLAAWGFCSVMVGERLACLTFLSVFIPLIALARVGYEVVSRTRGFRRRLLFLGVGDHAQRTARELLAERSRDFDLVGFLGSKPEEKGWRIGGRPVLGSYDEVERVAAEHRIDRIVVAVADRRSGQFPLEALLNVRLSGVEIVEEAKVHEEIAGKIPVEDLRPSWLIFSDGFSNSRLRNLNKRAFDVVVAAAGLLLSAPLAALVALAIRLDSKGPILFRQKRVGQGGKEFTLCKFRSMRPDAEAGGRPQWAQKDDPRVTRLGRFLRKSRLDEIPQMWNVLQGTMSFVGPRPERAFFVQELRKRIPFYDQRHAVKPGITGWAQVRFRYGADETDAVEKLRHDMFYIKHHGILFDLRILLETVRVVLRRDMGR